MENKQEHDDDDNIKKYSAYQLYELAVCYHFGLGNYPQSLSRALQLYSLASKEGNHRAQYNLAYLFHYGIHVERNIPLALRWYYISHQCGNEYASECIHNILKQ